MDVKERYCGLESCIYLNTKKDQEILQRKHGDMERKHIRTPTSKTRAYFDATPNHHCLTQKNTDVAMMTTRNQEYERKTCVFVEKWMTEN